mgnify:CR=1 FL=1
MDASDEKDVCDAVVSVDAGACRFRTRIVGQPDGNSVRLIISSDCPCVRQLAEELRTAEPFEALRMPFSKNPIFSRAEKFLKHATCPVPTAILKCIEAASDLALKKSVRIEFES